MGPGEEASDALVHHNFKGTWKKGETQPVPCSLLL